MKFNKVNLIDICNPKQWKNLPISELTEDGYLVYGANGIIGRYKEYNHELPTIAITCRGATCGTINITEPNSYITSNAMALDDVSSDVDQGFLYFVLRNYNFNRVISGTAQPQITREGLSKVIINIPEKKADQLHIANILTKAESLIAQRKESISLLDEYLKSVFLEMFGDPLENPKNFEIKTLKDFYINPKEGTKCGPFGSALKKHEYTSSGVPVWNMDNISVDGNFVSNINLFITEEKYSKLSAYSTFDGDIIISRAGTVGKMCVLKSGFVKSIHYCPIKI